MDWSTLPLEVRQIILGHVVEPDYIPSHVGPHGLDELEGNQPMWALEICIPILQKLWKFPLNEVFPAVQTCIREVKAQQTVCSEALNSTYEGIKNLDSSIRNSEDASKVKLRSLLKEQWRCMAKLQDENEDLIRKRKVFVIILKALVDDGVR